VFFQTGTPCLIPAQAWFSPLPSSVHGRRSDRAPGAKPARKPQQNDPQPSPLTALSSLPPV
jgi:hypothetical protein